MTRVSTCLCNVETILEIEDYSLLSLDCHIVNFQDLVVILIVVLITIDLENVFKAV